MIPGLDGLRAIAFILVFGIHTDYLGFGWTGVQLFFVLSGFLITGILLDMKASLPSKGYFVKFYGRRFLRIFPLYYFYLFVMWGVTSWLYTLSYRRNYMKLFQAQLPFALAYVYNFFYGSSAFEHQKFVEHFWSLSVEEQFYVFWPMLLFLVPEKYLKKLFLFCIALGPLLRVALFFAYRFHLVWWFRDEAVWGLYAFPFSHIDAFALGAYISRYRIPRAKQQFFALLVAVPVIGFAAQYAATGSFGMWQDVGYPFSMPKAYQFIWGYSILNYWFAVTIYAVARNGLFNRFLEMKPIKYLGKISYGLYVYHLAIIWFVGRIRDWWPIFEEPTAKLLTAIIALPLTVLVASLSYFLLEKPLLNLKERFFSLKSSDKEGTVALGKVLPG
ncbi:MAG: acyltransferase family protein [Anaerolineales bacterium]|jgi:peptidoglycan/LPS O-acetylase OafA/YrhL